MIFVGKWRWPLIVGLSLMVGSLLVGGGIGRLRYDGRALLVCSVKPHKGDQELVLFRKELARRKINVILASAPGRGFQISLEGQGNSSREVAQELRSAAEICVTQSMEARRGELLAELERLQGRRADWKTKFDQLVRQRNALLTAPKHQRPKGDIKAKMAELKTRRQFLIERYPTHTDIPLLAKQIKELQNQSVARETPMPQGNVTDVGRQINEAKLRMDYYGQQIRGVSMSEHSLKPAWKILESMSIPKRPSRMDHWPLCAGIVIGTFALGCLFVKGERRSRASLPKDGLWRPEPEVPQPEVEAAESETVLPPEVVVQEVPPTVDEPVRLEVVSPESRLPSDPLTGKAATLYGKWIDMAKILYQPAPQPPQGVLDQVGPLLQESSDFLPQGHDVLARYLAQSVTPGDLPAHVARTVLMTITAAQEAGASPEHRLAITLAALFHDLAVVPRPPSVQEEAGSEVGRLSASLLRRIPGLPPALISMVEDILIGMDEFKLETWQNVTNGKSLEPLSKVLREIDRFEKVMQKQRTRLDRQIAHRKAI